MPSVDFTMNSFCKKIPFADEKLPFIGESHFVEKDLLSQNGDTFREIWTSFVKNPFALDRFSRNKIVDGW